MDDQTLLARIEALVAEEHSLIGREEGDATDGSALEQDRRRLEQLSLELDRCWDLLRRRRALREAGRDPGEAGPRDTGTVEGYLQ